jgi:hypothetical protein
MSKADSHRGTTGLFAQPIGKGLHQHHKHIFPKSTLELIRLGTYWPEIVGEELTTLTRPVKLAYSKSTGCLHIGSHSAAALELQHMQPVLLQRIHEIMGHRRVGRLKFVPI